MLLRKQVLTAVAFLAVLPSMLQATLSQLPLNAECPTCSVCKDPATGAFKPNCVEPLVAYNCLSPFELPACDNTPPLPPPPKGDQSPPLPPPAPQTGVVEASSTAMSTQSENFVTQTPQSSTSTALTGVLTNTANPTNTETPTNPEPSINSQSIATSTPALTNTADVTPCAAAPTVTVTVTVTSRAALPTPVSSNCEANSKKELKRVSKSLKQKLKNKLAYTKKGIKMRNANRESKNQKDKY
ncbi:hypothetical protein BKA69DRAFT_833765 [Paraphysoderma sedebokerense]|nr:hypothetical protein BKA69DRAFT_833765 [Paraphysoderma sedebokerense]